MKFLKKMKDGGNESTVTGYWLIECKSLFSIAILKFEGKSREAYHEHAFNCLSWILKGELKEEMKDGRVFLLTKSLVPFLTTRKDFHKVSSVTPVTWLLTLRGPWKKTWREYREESGKTVILTNGRKVVTEERAP